MNIYDKISRMTGKETYDEKMYKLLCDEKYKSNPYAQTNLGEEMTLIKEVIWGWYKPRYLLDHRTKCAYEFMTPHFELLTVADDDIDWDSLKPLSEDLIERAKAHNGHFPTLIFAYHNGIAEVEWQLNPDGRYYMDDDGFGMTDDVEVALYGYIDRTGKVVKKFTYKP